MPAPSNRRHIIAPLDHWDAFQSAAKSAGLSLSEWLCRAAEQQLPAKVRKELSERRGPGQPRKVDDA